MKVIEIRKAGPGKPNVWLEAGNNDLYPYKSNLGLLREGFIQESLFNLP